MVWGDWRRHRHSPGPVRPFFFKGLFAGTRRAALTNRRRLPQWRLF